MQTVIASMKAGAYRQLSLSAISNMREMYYYIGAGWSERSVRPLSGINEEKPRCIDR